MKAFISLVRGVIRIVHPDNIIIFITSVIDVVQDCYVIDPCSKIGLCVWIGTDSDLDVRAECACRAELILRRRSDCPPRPVGAIFVYLF